MSSLFLIIHYGTVLSIVLRIISSVTLLFFFIPLQLKEALVKNGLRKLRLQLLAVGVLLFLENILTVYLLLNILLSSSHQQLDNILAQIFNATIAIALSFTFYNIYHFQYSDKQKVLHAKIELQEGR
jgi:hypothetical protein